MFCKRNSPLPPAPRYATEHTSYSEAVAAPEAWTVWAEMSEEAGAPVFKARLVGGGGSQVLRVLGAPLSVAGLCLSLSLSLSLSLALFLSFSFALPPCVCVYLYTYIYTYLHIILDMYMHIYIYTYRKIRRHLHIHIHIYICTCR